MSLNASKILIIAPSWVGDMVMAHCLFKLIKQQNPATTLDVLAPSWTFSLLSLMPEVNDAIEMPVNHGELKLKTRYTIAKALRTRDYQQAIVLPNSFKSALIPFLAKIPQRTGWKREGRHLFLLNDARTLDKNRFPLMIEQYMALGLNDNSEALPKPYAYPSFHVTPLLQQSALNKYQLEKINDKPVLALCAGAEFGPSKRWPPSYYAETAQQKLKAGWDVWLFGSPKDCAIADEIMQRTDAQCHNLTGRTTLADSIALLSLATGVICNDSGLMHIAAALNKPIIALYGSTSPRFTPPLSHQAMILQTALDCQPCFERKCPLQHHRCMRDLTPAQVLSAMRENWDCH